MAQNKEKDWRLAYPNLESFSFILCLCFPELTGKLFILTMGGLGGFAFLSCFLFLGISMSDKKSRLKAKALTKFASSNRLNPTDAEAIMKNVLTKSKTGERWTFERPWKGKYILDFYCPQAKLVVEVDGGYHLARRQKDKDLDRDGTLFLSGISVIRISNDDALYQTDKVLSKIIEMVNVRTFEKNVIVC